MNLKKLLFLILLFLSQNYIFSTEIDFLNPRDLTESESELYSKLIKFYKDNHTVDQLKNELDINTCCSVLSLRKQKLAITLHNIKRDSQWQKLFGGFGAAIYGLGIIGVQYVKKNIKQTTWADVGPTVLVSMSFPSIIGGGSVMAVMGISFVSSYLSIKILKKELDLINKLSTWLECQTTINA